MGLNISWRKKNIWIKSKVKLIRHNKSNLYSYKLKSLIEEYILEYKNYENCLKEKP